MQNRLNKRDFTISDFISLVRILLIPVIIRLYYVYPDNTASAIVIACSALAGGINEFIIKRHTVPAFRKVIGPVAGKLTQAALIICLFNQYQWMTALGFLFIIKEGFMTIAGYLSWKVAGSVGDIKWYGRISAAVSYTVLTALILFDGLSAAATDTLIFVCGLSVLMSLILYAVFYIGFFKRKCAEKHDIFINLWKGVFLLVWLSVILIFIYFNRNISLEGILRFTPSNLYLAAAAIIALFALKSISFVIYIGILFAASGIIFSLPAAILINICGTAVAVSIPYAIGRKIGAEAVDRITERYPKAKAMRRLRSGNDFIFSLLVRLIGFLPCDVISLYMGSIRMRYSSYLTGCLLGFLPCLVSLTVMGTSVTDIRSPAFIIALCAKVIIAIFSVLFSFMYKRKTG